MSEPRQPPDIEALKRAVEAHFGASLPARRWWVTRRPIIDGWSPAEMWFLGYTRVVKELVEEVVGVAHI